MLNVPGQNLFQYEVEASLGTTGITVVMKNGGANDYSNSVIIYHDCSTDAHGKVSAHAYTGGSGVNSYDPTGEFLFTHTYGQSGAGSITNSVHCTLSGDKRIFFFESDHANLIKQTGANDYSGFNFENKITVRVEGYTLTDTQYDATTGALINFDYSAKCRFNRHDKNTISYTRCDSNAPAFD